MPKFVGVCVHWAIEISVLNPSAWSDEHCSS